MPDRSYREWPFLDDEHRALARALASLTAALAEPRMAGARDAVARVVSGTWTEGLRALLLTEAHASDAAVSCRRGLRTVVLSDVATSRASGRAADDRR